MPGDVIGFSCGAEIIVASPSPLGKDAPSPKEVADALVAHLQRTGFEVAGVKGHRVVEAHVYRVAPTLSAIRDALGLESPWLGKRKR